MVMGPAVYLLATLVCLISAVLLLRGFFAGRHRLLLWSGLCLLGLTVNNLLVFIDLVLLPHTDLYPLRLLVGAASTLLLLFGLVLEAE